MSLINSERKIIQLPSEKLLEFMKEYPQYQYLDVREVYEVSENAIEGFRNIPLGELKKSLAILDKNKPVVILCHSGGRSLQAAGILLQNEFKEVYNVSKGIMRVK